MNDVARDATPNWVTIGVIDVFGGFNGMYKYLDKLELLYDYSNQNYPSTVKY